MKSITYICLVFQLILIISCKSPQKLFDQGNYEKAVYSSVNDLQRSTGNADAKQLLIKSYDEARRQSLAAIETARISDNPDKADLIYSHYLSLQKMYNAIAAVPAAKTAVNPVDYSLELIKATETAAEYRYLKAEDFLSAGGRDNARKAYENFKMADKYVPGYKDVLARKKEASELATTNVVLNNIRQQFGFYSVNGAFLENDILWELKSIGRDNFYAFYTSTDAQYKGIRVDQVMDLFMYDIWFGTLAENRYSYNVSKVLTEPAPNPKDPPVKVTVTATVNVTKQTIDSRVVMDCNITDLESRRIIVADRIPARYTWENVSGTYTGDYRALSTRDNAIVNGMYNNPPSYDELYRLLTRQILSDLNFRMRQVYGK